MKPRRILVVDDEPGIRQSLGGVLEDEGYSVASVESGEACLETLAGGEFEVALLDIWLPGMDGLEVLRSCKEDRALRDIPSIMSSGETLRTKIKEVEEAGAEAYIMKPFSFDALQDTIERIWSNHTVSHCL